MTSAESKRHCILVVEDDPDIRDLEVTVLEDLGYSVAAAMNGAEALDYLRESARPCLIMLDLMMPVMDGFEFVRERLKDADIAQIPIVIVSALSREDARISDAGVVAHITKPHDIDLLAGTIERLCPRPMSDDHPG
jgi:CheY-like chemotaxis protein